MTSPEEALTGSDVSHGSVLRTRQGFPRFFLTIVVVQNVPLRMTDMATGSDAVVVVVVVAAAAVAALM